MHGTPDAPLKGRAAGSHAQSLRPLTAHARSDSDASSWMAHGDTHGCPQLTMDMHTGVIDARHGWRAEQRTSAPLNSVPATRGSCCLLAGSFGTQLPRVVLLEKGGPAAKKLHDGRAERGPGVKLAVRAWRRAAAWPSPCDHKTSESCARRTVAREQVSQWLLRAAAALRWPRSVEQVVRRRGRHRHA